MDIGHEVHIDGHAVRYLSADDPLPPLAERALSLDLFEDDALRLHPRVRRVLSTLVRPTPLFYGVLHWSDGTDLRLLDEKIVSGQATENDFAGAIYAEPRSISCLTCGALLRVLAVDTGNVLASAERLSDHGFQPECPVCRSALGLYVVEFLDNLETV